MGFDPRGPALKATTHHARAAPSKPLIRRRGRRNTGTGALFRVGFKANSPGCSLSSMAFGPNKGHAPLDSSIHRSSLLNQIGHSRTGLHVIVFPAAAINHDPHFFNPVAPSASSRARDAVGPCSGLGTGRCRTVRRFWKTGSGRAPPR